MPARKIGGKWWVDVWIDVPEEGRRRFRRRAPFRTKKETETFEQELIADVLSTSRRSEQEDEAEKRPERRYRDFAVEFLKTYVVTNNKYSEVMTKESILRVHLIPAFGRLLLEEILPAVIERYKAEKLEGGLKAKTINNQLTVLRKSLVVAQEWEYLATVPPIKWMKAAKPSFDFLDFEEAARLVKAAEEEWRPMVVLAMKTGLRMGELRGLRWEDVDLISRRLMVRRAVARGRIGTPKSNRQRWLPLCSSAVEALKAHRHLRGELIFCKEDGRMVTKNEMKSPLWRACRRAGLRKIGWHCLRHYPSHRIIPPRASATVAVGRE